MSSKVYLSTVQLKEAQANINPEIQNQSSKELGKTVILNRTRQVLNHGKIKPGKSSQLKFTKIDIPMKSIKMIPLISTNLDINKQLFLRVTLQNSVLIELLILEHTIASKYMNTINNKVLIVFMQVQEKKARPLEEKSLQNQQMRGLILLKYQIKLGRQRKKCLNQLKVLKYQIKLGHQRKKCLNQLKD